MPAETALVAMPESSSVPGDRMVHVADRVSELALWGGGAVAFAGIHVVALYRKAVTAMLWHLLALVSPGGRVPVLRWFVWRCTSGCAYLGLFVGATGVMWPYVRPGSRPLPLDRLLRDNATPVITVCLLLMLLHQSWGRNIVLVNRDVWGNRWKAVLAILLEMAVLLTVAWLFVLANKMLH